MALAQTQALLARIFTDAQARRDFFADPAEAGARFGLSEAEAATLAALDRREVEAFAKSLLGKRALDARKALPLTARALGKRFDPLFREAIDGASPAGRCADAAALAHLLASRQMEPPWIGDLARYEVAFIAAARPGATFILRRFAYPVNDIARQLLAGAHPNVVPRRRFGFWLRAPGGRLFRRMF